MARSSQAVEELEMQEANEDDGRRSEERRRLNKRDSTESGTASHRTQAQPSLSVRTSHSMYDKNLRNNEDEHTEAAFSVSGASAHGVLKGIKATIAAFFSDIFGSEFDFGTAYRRAKGLSDELQSSITTRTDQQEQVRAWDHLKLFPLAFKDPKFETQYGLICGQLFIGRLCVVLIFLVFMVIPILWLLGALCFHYFDLSGKSVNAWISFHIAFGVNWVIAVVSLVLTIFPKIIPLLRRYFEVYAYVNVLAWLCIMLIVLATFPNFVKSPHQMDLLWSVDAASLGGAVREGHPICNQYVNSSEISTFFACLKSETDISTCLNTCVANPECVSALLGILLEGGHFCQQINTLMVDGFESLGTDIEHIWQPFAVYLPFVKITLQVFKIPLIAQALINCVFGTGLMFLDTMSPSRTKITIIMHLLVVPLCAVPYVILYRLYPSVVPLEETLIFVFSFFFVACAGWCGRYAQEFQHRLIFCSWRLTTTMLQELHKKLEVQKEGKKSSTAIEELIFQVKECSNVVRLARLRGPRADVTDDLFKAEQLLDKILEMLTTSGNLYTVRFTEATKENEVQRQFIEMYNNPDKLRKSTAGMTKGERMATTGSRSLAPQTTLAAKMHETGGALTSAFGSAPSSSGPVIGFEFNSETLMHSFTSSHMDDTYLLWKNMPTPKATTQLLACVGVDWDFDVLGFSHTTENVLVEVGYALLCRLVGDWGCDESQLIRFLVAIQGQYLPNPYHNKLHGATVAHLTECLTRMLNAQRTMNSIDKVTLTIAAICHDVGHPGRNNQFFVNCYDPLAVIYNDQAVLENFHSCLTFRTLEMKECNVFMNLEDSEFRYLRQNLIACILATDMKQHFESISRFRVRRNSPEFCYSKTPEDRWLVARMCMKVADIGHSSVPWSQHFQWSCRVVEEFYQQGDEEVSRGMPISPLCDREKHADMAKSQNGFLEFVVKPLLKEIEEIEPFSFIKNVVSKNLADNLSKWQMLQEGGHPIALNTDDNAQKTTVTAGAVRRIAGIKRGAHDRAGDHLTVPAQLKYDIDHHGEQHQQPAAPEPPNTGADMPAEGNPPSPDDASSESFEADFSEQVHFVLPTPPPAASPELTAPEPTAPEPLTMELRSPSGQRRRVRITTMAFLESSSRPAPE